MNSVRRRGGKPNRGGGRARGGGGRGRGRGDGSRGRGDGNRGRGAPRGGGGWSSSKKGGLDIDLDIDGPVVNSAYDYDERGGGNSSSYSFKGAPSNNSSRGTSSRAGKTRVM